MARQVRSLRLQVISHPPAGAGTAHSRISRAHSRIYIQAKAYAHVSMQPPAGAARLWCSSAATAPRAWQCQRESTVLRPAGRRRASYDRAASGRGLCAVSGQRRSAHTHKLKSGVILRGRATHCCLAAPGYKPAQTSIGAVQPRQHAAHKLTNEQPCQPATSLNIPPHCRSCTELLYKASKQASKEERKLFCRQK